MTFRTLTTATTAAALSTLLLAGCGDDGAPPKKAEEKPPADCTDVIAEVQRNIDQLDKEGELKDADRDAITAGLDRARASLQAGEVEKCKDVAEQSRALSETLLAARTKEGKPKEE